jgi:hypothetical protein
MAKRAAQLAIGTLVEKTGAGAHDTHQNGARGKVLKAVANGYVVEWESEPERPVFIRAGKLKIAGKKR